MTEVDLAQAPEQDSRRFWLGLAFGWAAYFVLNVLLVATFEDAPPGRIVRIGLVNVVPPAIMSIVVALNRRRLLRPEWRLRKTLLVHKAVGLLFALGTTAIALLLMPGGGAIGELADASGPVRFASVMLNGIFLYIIFFGFLMWSESIRRVQESHWMAAHEAVLRAEAEARAIRAQFNPHFVFNTLHSLMLLVRADPALAERAIEDVATLIRYASIVQRRDIDAVPLAKELEVARRYVALEHLRLQDRLSFTWRVDTDPERVTVPAFALQTLVENAIKHGLEPRPGGGHAEAVVASDGGTLTVSVSDDGVGADPEGVAAAEGHGLSLLRRRLRARYGEAGRVEWETRPGEGFRVTVTMPAEAATPMPVLDVIEERSGAGQLPARKEDAIGRG